MRLIDAGKLLKEIDNDMYMTSILIKRSIKDKEEYNYRQLCGRRSALTDYYDIVRKQPTAFDVDKVVAQLEALDNAEVDYYSSNDVIDREDAIDIVRKGGTDED